MRANSLVGTLVPGALLAAVPIPTDPAIAAGEAFEQASVTVTRSDASHDQPAVDVWDLLAFRQCHLKLIVENARLDAAASVKVLLQTNTAIERSDWRTVGEARFVQGVNATPLVFYSDVRTEAEVPLLRHVRWSVLFETDTPSQFVTFAISAVCRE